jgi:hypothetical protein
MKILKTQINSSKNIAKLIDNGEGNRKRYRVQEVDFQGRKIYTGNHSTLESAESTFKVFAR